MILTQAILNEAKKWLDCREEGNNRGKCVNELRRLYDTKLSANAWCALFVWTITNEACKRLGVDNPLLRTESTANMLAAAKKSSLRVDAKPAVGCVFYTSRTGGGHVGFVLDVIGTKFKTIEGNTTSDSGDSGEGVWEKVRDTKTRTYQFIHLEDLDTIENNLGAGFGLSTAVADPRTYIVGTLILAVSGYLVYSKWLK